jgi:hypothetical protein
MSWHFIKLSGPVVIFSELDEGKTPVRAWSPIFNIKSSIINDNELIIKIPSRNNSKNIKIFDSNNNFILFDSLKIGDTIIVNIVNKTLSVNNSILYYYFHAKEILILN